jgi:Fur family ferric uptake transcriptional regulator
VTGERELHATAATRLRDSDQRYTAGRRRIVDILAGAARPLTIAEVQSQSGDLPQSSVYRNVTVLEHAGVVRRVLAADDFARFELAEDLTEHHHHLVCVSCGDVTDFTVPPALERAIERATGSAAGAAGFEVHHHRLDLVGTCGRCRQ